jgi:phage shock protein A
MPHFSRLTDIITCNLTEILSHAADPEFILREILTEMQEGLQACARNLQTSLASQQRLEQEISSCQIQSSEWKSKARQALLDAHEESARQALQRSIEFEDLIAGLRPELEAATSNSRNMTRIRKALDARYAEALRTLQTLTDSTHPFTSSTEPTGHQLPLSPGSSPDSLELQLEALRKDLRTPPNPTTPRHDPAGPTP